MKMNPQGSVAPRASQDAYMGTEKNVAMTPNLVQNPKPSVSAAPSFNGKGVMSFKTNGDGEQMSC